MRSIALTFAAVVLVGCCPPRVIATSTTDSVRVDVVERIVEVRDTAYIEVARDEQRVVVRDTTSVLSNMWATSCASVDTLGYLHHSLLTIPQTIAKPRTISVPIADTTRTRVVHHTDVVEVERELTWWQQTQMRGFWLLASIFALYMAWRVAKRRRLLR